MESTSEVQEKGYAHIKVHSNQLPLLEKTFCEWFMLSEAEQDIVLFLMQQSGFVLRNAEEQQDGLVRSYIFITRGPLNDAQLYNIKEVSDFFSDIRIPHLIEVPDTESTVLTNID